MKYVFRFGVLLLTTLMSYLSGAFVAADYNIATWATGGKVVLVLVWMTILFMWIIWWIVSDRREESLKEYQSRNPTH